MTTIPELCATLQTLFTTTADQVAHRTRFVQRASKLTGAVFAQAMTFARLAHGQPTLAEITQAAAVAGVVISPQGLDQRCGEDGALFLEALVGAAIGQVVQAAAVPIPLLARFTTVEVRDSTTIRLPDALAPWWPGCGGTSALHTSAAVKVHVGYDLRHGTLTGLHLSDGRTHDSTAPLQTAPLPRGALRISDLGYFDLQVFAALSDQGVSWLSRLQHSTVVLSPAGGGG